MPRSPDEHDHALRSSDATDAERSPVDRASEPARGRPWQKPPEPGPAAPEMSLRSEIEKIIPGPGHSQEVDERVRERMEEESPDGRPPTLDARHKSRVLFFAALAIVWAVVLVAVYLVGGIAMAALVLLLTAIYIGYAAWPTWRAALERRTDEERAEREVDAEIHPGSPEDRPPAQNG